MKNLEQDIARMIDTPGVYILTDSTLPFDPIRGGRVVVVCFVSSGKIFQMAPDAELSPNGFLSSCEIHGPFNAPKP